MTEDEILQWCRANFAGYKVPAGVTFVEELPRNALGKVVKQALRDRI